ncbi:hypothetical protein GQ53DRAFT_756333 [Thozetella sp. PMI_491]|nr:hypothetical protein GQ53DRAFT_756333 [Thozetella sp. PMI_491]
MVYQGPSRGCYSCKRRRKKCDETRPSCLRCIRANRTCCGYEHAGVHWLYHYPANSIGELPPPISAARKCTLPARKPIPGTDIIPVDALPPETTRAQSDLLSLWSFFYDYCVIPANHDLSRGFLSNLEPLTNRLGYDSDLVRACQAIALGHHGKILSRPLFTERAEQKYEALLGSFASAIGNIATGSADEKRRVAMLLGIYQITMASEADHGDHVIHAKGFAALMRLGNSSLQPLSLMQYERSPGLGRRIRKGASIFSVAALSVGDECLDDLLLDLEQLWDASEDISSADYRSSLKKQCMALDRRFESWQASRDKDFQPTVVAKVSDCRNAADIAAGYWPGRVEAYFDLYVAGVWNIFRTARLLLNALVVKLSDASGDSNSRVDCIHTANRLAEDLAASVPYHLAENMHDFVNKLDARKEMEDAGKVLGGLLLMHPLYIASRMSFLSEKIREYMRACLMWIGSNMGVGQATVLAKNPNIDREYLESGLLIIWSGFLG